MTLNLHIPEPTTADIAEAHAHRVVAALVSVVAEIASERQRQIDAEGWVPEHDDSHADGEMAMAAAAYAISGAGDRTFYPHGKPASLAAFVWQWSPHFWNPKDARRDLIRAAALIVAEIERLDRAAIARAEGAAP